MTHHNVYLEQIDRVLPRLLALYDVDPTSPSYGMGDRYRWAWKLVDFGTGTYQGAAHGLARLLAAGLLGGRISEAAALRRIDAMFQAAAALRRRDGSLEEAFPFESSFCVTAQVAYDLLAAVELLGERWDEARRGDALEVVRPLIRFLETGDERHGFISNHLATAAAALFRWHRESGDGGEGKGRELLSRILAAQSSEGWFPEYQGADPGYQTLCTYYLADVHRLRPDLELLEPLARSVEFLWHFAHPDGSFGGLYGSRNTRLYVPAGLEALAAEVPKAASLAAFMRAAVAGHRCVTLDTMDDANLVPMWNAYAWAAAEAEGESLPAAEPVPARSPRPARVEFPEAGLVVDRGAAHYTVVSSHKGGVCYHFRDGRPARIDAGVVARAPGGGLYSTQAQRPDNPYRLEDGALRVTAPLTAMRRRLPTPAQFLALRVLNLTLMRWRWLSDLVKKSLVRLLITGKKAAGVRNTRTIRLGRDLRIEDVWEGGSKGFTRLETGAPFAAIHMASQGYWQTGDDER